MVCRSGGLLLGYQQGVFPLTLEAHVFVISMWPPFATRRPRSRAATIPSAPAITRFVLTTPPIFSLTQRTPSHTYLNQGQEAAVSSNFNWQGFYYYWRGGTVCRDLAKFLHFLNVFCFQSSSRWLWNFLLQNFTKVP